MAQDPAFLFYSQDFYTGVATMNFEDRGKYITLLCLMHQQGRLSDETIRFVVGSVSVILSSKFKIDETGLWYNERLELEAAKRSNFTQSRRDNGNKGGRPVKKEPTDKPTNNLMDNHNVNLMENENENANEIKNNSNSEENLVSATLDNFKQYFDNDYKVDEIVIKANGFSPDNLKSARQEFWNEKQFDKDLLSSGYLDVRVHFIRYCKLHAERIKKMAAGESKVQKNVNAFQDLSKKYNQQ